MATVRFYICPLSYDPEPEEADGQIHLGNYPYLHDLKRHIDWSCMIPTNNQGNPKFSHCLVKVKADDHSFYQADLAIIDLFEGIDVVASTKTEFVRALSKMRFTSIPQQVRKTIKGHLESIGITAGQISNKLKNTDSLRKGLRLAIEKFKNDSDYKTCDEEIENGYMGV